MSLTERYRDATTDAVRTELECWLWDLTELDADLADDPTSWAFPEQSRAFILFQIESATAELQRRHRLSTRPGAPRWPHAWSDRRLEASTIKANLSIVDYLAARGVSLKQYGKELKARCPLPGHDERTPSFSVRADGTVWHCFGCHRGGDLFTLHMHLTGDDDFAAAIRDLAEDAGITGQAA